MAVQPFEEKKKYKSPDCTATATVVLTVQVKCDGSWGGDCPMDQIHKQAVESAENILRTAKDAHRRIKILKVDEIKSIVVSKKN